MELHFLFHKRQVRKTPADVRACDCQVLVGDETQLMLSTGFACPIHDFKSSVHNNCLRRLEKQKPI